MVASWELRRACLSNQKCRDEPLSLCFALICQRDLPHLCLPCLPCLPSASSHCTPLLPRDHRRVQTHQSTVTTTASSCARKTQARPTDRSSVSVSMLSRSTVKMTKRSGQWSELERAVQVNRHPCKRRRSVHVMLSPHSGQSELNTSRVQRDWMCHLIDQATCTCMCTCQPTVQRNGSTQEHRRRRRCRGTGQTNVCCDCAGAAAVQSSAAVQMPPVGARSFGLTK